MQTQYNLFWVTCSILVAIFASYVAMNIAKSVIQSAGRVRAVWVLFGSLAMGIGIWSMHFIGMLAFEMPGMAMAYDLPLVILSVIVAVVGSVFSLLAVSRPTVTTNAIIFGGVSMAAAIAGMHYIGMASMVMGARIVWNWPLVALSVLIALFAAFGALFIFSRSRTSPRKAQRPLLASTVMGFAISGMHYTGMIAATYEHTEEMTMGSNDFLVTSGLTFSVTVATLSVLAIALFSSLGLRFVNRRIQALDGLEGREHQLRTITNAVPVLIAQVDAKLNILFANEAFAHWHNLGNYQRTVMNFRDILGERYPLNEPFITRAFAGETVTYERLSNSGEDTATLSITLVPEKGPGGITIGLVIVATDITKHKAIQSELSRAKEAAEDANKTKSAFLANMSHEIRTPLGAVMGFSELLATQEMTESDRQNSLEVIKRNGRLLSNIINDILDLSKVEAGRLNVEKSPVAFEDILREMGSVLNLEAEEKGIELNVSSVGAIPNRLITDPLRLRQILFNIVGNAIKFTERGSVNVRVQLLDGPMPKLAFVVKDTGEGIPEDKVGHLFSPFTQADVSTTRKFGGTGLGLVLSRKLANALGGDVVLTESTLGVGSTFTITVDPGMDEQSLSQGASPAADVTPAKMWNVPATQKTAMLSNLKVLLVEDSHDNQILIKRVLKFSGAVVETADNGREAVEKIQGGHHFDVVLMDLQMPEMDGYEATQLLRSGGYAKPIIALTAHAMQEERERSLRSGFDHHLTKPIDNAALIRTLALYLRS